MRSVSSRSLKETVNSLDQCPVQLESAAYASVLQRCREVKALAEGKRLHALIAQFGLDRDTFLGNLLVQMYGHCGSIEDARRTFDRIHRKNVFSGNIMVAGFVHNGHLQDARSLFEAMPQRNVVSWTTMVSSYSQNGHLQEAENVFEKMPVRNVVSWNAMLSAFAQNGLLDDAHYLFDNMPERDVASWNAMIQLFADSGQVDNAERVYGKMPLQGVVSSTAMFSAYAQNGQLQEARMMFDSMPERNVISWNALINAYAQSGLLHDAWIMFAEMPEKSTLAWNTLIQAYGQSGHLDAARILFEQMSERDAGSWTAIVAAYANNGYLCTARSIVEEMQNPSLASWNVLIQAYARNGHPEEALTTFYRMPQKDTVSWTAMIGAYAQSGDVDHAKCLFNEMPGRDLISWTAIITAYAQNEHMEDARNMFGKMPQWDAVCWNAMIAQANNLADSKCMFDEMPWRNSASWNAMFSTYVQNGNIEGARTLFDKIPQRDAVLWNAMMQACMDKMYFEEARTLFDKMPVPNTVSWTTLITAYAQVGHPKEILRLFCTMDLEGVRADEITYATILDACGCHRAYIEGRTIHTNLVEFGTSLQSDVVAIALIDMYGKCGCPEDARSVFDNALQYSAVPWTAMVAAYAQSGHSSNALELFHKMILEGVKPDAIAFITVLDACGTLPAVAEGKSIHSSIIELGFEKDVAVSSALISMYGKWGCAEESRNMFDKMPERNVIVWTAMITAYAQNAHAMGALKLFMEMDLEGVRPDHVAYIGILNACTSLAAITEGKIIHEETVCNGVGCYSEVGTALLNMYAKCGYVDEARAIFDSLPKVDVVSWTAMVTAYAQNGHGKETISFFRIMQLQGISPENVTFVSILSACSHAGLVGDGWSYFVSMQMDYGIEATMEHYVCMVDLLGRAGKLEEAEDLIDNMPFKPEAVGWMVLLAACKSYGHVERGARAAQRVFEQDEGKNSAPYVLLSSIHAGHPAQCVKERTDAARNNLEIQ